MIKKNTLAYLAIREDRLNKIAADYRKIIREAVASAGGEKPLSAKLKMSENYVRESLRGGISGLKKCAELIGATEEP